MRKLVLMIALPMLFCVAAMAQRQNILVGTWICHYPGYYVDGEEIFPKEDRYLRISEVGGNLSVSIKRGKGGEFWGYSEATHVLLNRDGSLSFNEFYDNKVKHENGVTSHCYTKYNVWLEGNKLYVKPLSVSFWYDRNGNLYGQTETEERPAPILVYHNEKDNW